jgi:hypothetical protein
MGLECPELFNECPMNIEHRIDRSLERVRRAPELLGEIEGMLNQSRAAIAASRDVMGVERWPYLQVLALVAFETREVRAPELVAPLMEGGALQDRLHRVVNRPPDWLAWLGFPIRYR